MTDLYVDTTALLKRVFVEPESSAVTDLLRERSANGDLLAACDLAWIEVARALLRAGVDDVEAELSNACAGIARQRLDPVVVTRARTIGPPRLRSLAAINLAAAIGLGVTEILTFDHRLASAARTVGLRPILA